MFSGNQLPPSMANSKTDLSKKASIIAPVAKKNKGTTQLEDSSANFTALKYPDSKGKIKLSVKKLLPK